MHFHLSSCSLFFVVFFGSFQIYMQLSREGCGGSPKSEE